MVKKKVVGRLDECVMVSVWSKQWKCTSLYTLPGGQGPSRHHCSQGPFIFNVGILRLKWGAGGTVGYWLLGFLKVFTEEAFRKRRDFLNLQEAFSVSFHKVIHGWLCLWLSLLCCVKTFFSELEIVKSVTFVVICVFGGGEEMKMEGVRCSNFQLLVWA